MYRDYIQTIAQDIEDRGVEVCLAVRLHSETPSATTDDEDTDEFLASHGFEYVDVDSHEQSDGDYEGKAIPSICHVDLNSYASYTWTSSSH